MRKHFVTFYSPGTFVSESTTEEINSWDTHEAVKRSTKVKERYGATPYGFSFKTVDKTGQAWDVETKTIAESGMYFLGGQIKTLEDVIAENNPENKILISNMKSNNWDKIIVNTNSWRITLPFTKEDTLLEICTK